MYTIVSLSDDVTYGNLAKVAVWQTRAEGIGLLFSYILMGTVICSIISSLCEMTALMPVNAPVMEFPRRFLDRGVGFAVGWMYW